MIKILKKKNKRKSKTDKDQNEIESQKQTRENLLMASEKENCCCTQKVTMRSDDEYKKLCNRLSRIEGQVRGIKKMVEENAYCPDILMQSAAVTAAMNAFNRELMSNHIKHCVARDIRNGKDETIDELVHTLEKLMK